MAFFSEISFNKIQNEVQVFLKTTYKKASLVFTNASPYGQILAIIQEFFQLSILYLKNSISNFDLSGPNNSNVKVIRTSALLAGHIPTRAISATGTLRFQINPSVNITDDIPGGKVTFTNKLAIKNNTNGLDYVIDLGQDKVSINIQNGSQFFLNIIQGKVKTDNFTADGTLNQSYSVNVLSNKDIENFNASVSVNGKNWNLKKHLYDLLPDEEACIVRTGFNGGIDIIFGNGGFGKSPEIGALIQVTYITTDGAAGNIFRRTPNDWKFVDDVLDGFGRSIDISRFFNIFIHTDINFGADGESVKFTKNILGISSNNFVLGLPQQYAYQIKKLGVFSHVNAYESAGIITIVATPNIKLFKNQNADYFTINKSAFELDAYEKIKIDKYLKTSGNLQLTRKYRIVSPDLSYYIMNVFIITYSDAIDDNVNSQIYDKVSEYFLNLNRMDRIPKVDLINQISSIYEIHSVDITFVSKNNEDYHKKYLVKDVNRRNQFADSLQLDLEKPFSDYDPNASIGIDPVLGDILFESNQIPLVRGGWTDRNNIFYSESPDPKVLNSINIIKKGTVDVKNRIKI
jgi:hypothetical protein